jgi:hypothetical protein
LPLLLAEWKAPGKPVFDAYDDNRYDYRDAIPQLLVNALAWARGQQTRGAVFSEIRVR